jgi:hypothetical protein
VTASPLEGGDATNGNGEREIASAPLDAGADASDPTASTCLCPQVSIRCNVTGPFHARADRASCTLELPASACRLFRFEDGTTADPRRILATEAPSGLDADDVFELCSTKHEAYHACDRTMNVPICAFELPAYDVSLECMRAFAADARVAYNIEGILAAREMNGCLCSSAPCDACLARCEASHPAYASTCEQARDVYCPGPT